MRNYYGLTRYPVGKWGIGSQFGEDVGWGRLNRPFQLISSIRPVPGTWVIVTVVSVLPYLKNDGAMGLGMINYPDDTKRPARMWLGNGSGYCLLELR